MHGDDLEWDNSSKSKEKWKGGEEDVVTGVGITIGSPTFRVLLASMSYTTKGTSEEGAYSPTLKLLAALIQQALAQQRAPHPQAVCLESAPPPLRPCSHPLLEMQ